MNKLPGIDCNGVPCERLKTFEDDTLTAASYSEIAEKVNSSFEDNNEMVEPPYVAKSKVETGKLTTFEEFDHIDVDTFNEIPNHNISHVRKQMSKYKYVQTNRSGKSIAASEVMKAMIKSVDYEVSSKDGVMTFLRKASVKTIAINVKLKSE